MSHGKGLEGVIAGTTAISEIHDGVGGIRYRGYELSELCERSTFEEVAFLLLHGRLPDRAELSAFRQTLVNLRALPERMRLLLEQLPADAHPMDVLRTSVSAMGCFEPESRFRDQFAVAYQLIASLGCCVVYWWIYHRQGRRIDTRIGDDTIAGNFLQTLLNRTPDRARLRALDVSLIIYAEHEFNTSAFAARVIASTLSDFHSAIAGAIGALKGPLHGGANQAAMELLARFRTPEEAEAGIREMLGRGEKIMGFGHPVYKHRADPRGDLIKPWAVQLASESEEGRRMLAVAERIERVMRSAGKPGPNVDFYTAIVYEQIGIPAPLATVLFALARTVGWSAHILEQRADNQIIRPSARYVGPAPRPYPG
ncbi:MAG: 2-methylcitrate synthase [Kiritimatiellae bacterium]|nr:2-methylcitrate synthase [Kiritimatiellia bacterium]MDW8459225.1 citrate/2-methylcitrate synthase [Verrucomicrobiota bacterium]